MFETSLGDDGAVLKPLEPWRSEELLANVDRGRDSIGRFIRLADAVADSASARAFLEDYARKTATDTGRIYGIWSDDVLVGGVLFRTMDVAQSTAEAGCWLEPAAVGRGLVTRASRRIIDWVIEERGFHRVEWRVSAGNTASIAVAQRLGMRREGVLRESYVHHGERVDIEIWAVLAPEWRAARADQAGATRSTAWASSSRARSIGNR